MTSCNANPDSLKYSYSLLDGIEKSEIEDKPIFIYFTCWACMGGPEFYEHLAISRKIQNLLNDEFIVVTDVPDYEADHQLYLGGEGMLATADGYADFIRMLLHRGVLNGHRFLEKEIVEDIYSPQTQNSHLMLLMP